ATAVDHQTVRHAGWRSVAGPRERELTDGARREGHRGEECVVHVAGNRCVLAGHGAHRLEGARDAEDRVDVARQVAQLVQQVHANVEGRAGAGFQLAVTPRRLRYDAVG